MDPIEALSIADGLLGLLEKVAPHIEEALKAGTITAEQQAAVFARAARFAPTAPVSAFAAPEWQPSDAPQPQPSGVTGFVTDPTHLKNNPPETPAV